MGKMVMIQNPFWEEVRQYGEDGLSWRSGGNYLLRHSYCQKYAWAIPDPQSLSFVVEWAGPGLVEMGAGMGYWAWQLSQLGVDILCYDIAPPDQLAANHWHSPKDRDEGSFTGELVETYHPLIQGEPEVLVQHSDWTLFLCWPPYDEDMATQCLQYYRGNRLIYIGEGEGGCNANDDFFSILSNEWKRVAGHSLPQWQSIHDYIDVYERTH